MHATYATYEPPVFGDAWSVRDDPRLPERRWNNLQWAALEAYRLTWDKNDPSMLKCPNKRHRSSRDILSGELMISPRPDRKLKCDICGPYVQALLSPFIREHFDGVPTWTADVVWNKTVEERFEKRIKRLKTGPKVLRVPLSTGKVRLHSTVDLDDKRKNRGGGEQVKGEWADDGWPEIEDLISERARVKKDGRWMDNPHPYAARAPSAFGFSLPWVTVHPERSRWSSGESTREGCLNFPESIRTWCLGKMRAQVRNAGLGYKLVNGEYVERAHFAILDRIEKEVLEWVERVKWAGGWGLAT